MMINFEQYLLERTGSSAGQQTKKKVNLDQLKEMIANKDPKIADVDVSEITYMRELFKDSDFGGSWTADLSGWDTSGVEDMGYMFSRCSKLKEVELYRTEKVENMSFMFSHCTSLKEVILPHTESVVKMNFMFDKCAELTEVDMPNTSKVREMSYMFGDCKALQKVPKLDTTSLEDIDGMFENCKQLKEIPKGMFNKVKTSKGFLNGTPLKGTKWW